MNSFLILLASLTLIQPAQAQRTVNPSPPCKARLNPVFKTWDEATINAVIKGIDNASRYSTHVEVGIGFPRSGANIRWQIDVTETKRNEASGVHYIVATVRVVDLQAEESRPKTFTLTMSDASSIEGAIRFLVQSAILTSGVEQAARAQGCTEREVNPEPSDVDSTARGPASTTTHIRAMTANISSGKKQSYDNGEGLRIFKGLKPDVVMIQEFQYKSNSPDDIQEMITTGFGEGYSYYRENAPKDTLPNGIITRFKILESGDWEDVNMPNRDYAWARMDIPGDRDLWAISVHLHSKNVITRQHEAEDLKKLITEKIPAQDYVLLGGDFNIVTRDNAIIGILADAVSEKAPPTDSNGVTATNAKRKNNYDWILVDSDLAQYQVPTEFKSNTEEATIALRNSFPNGLVFDSREFPLIERVGPVHAEDSAAENMQHMAVIKDFEVPAPDQAASSKHRGPSTRVEPRNPEWFWPWSWLPYGF